MKEKKRVIVCMLFFLILYAIWIGDLLLEDRLYSAWEKRRLSQKPSYSWELVVSGEYGTQYETWLVDQFPGRDLWVGLKNRCELLLGKRELQGIYIGKDGYLFSENQQIADWDAWEEKMQRQFGREAVSRIHVPPAGAVLLEKKPDYVVFTGREDAVFENLLRHRQEEIYYRTDHHWTMLGAYYAYEAWAEEQGLSPLALDEQKAQTVKEDFLGTHYGRIHYASQKDVIKLYDPGIACEVVYDLGQAKAEGLYQAQYLKTEDAYAFFLDGNHGVVQITTEGKEGHLAVLKDSYANCLVPFLTAHYGKITVLDPRYIRVDMGEWLAGQEVTQVLIVAQDTSLVGYEEP